MESNNNNNLAESNHDLNLDHPNPNEYTETDTLELQKRVEELEAKIAHWESGKSKISKSTLSVNRATLPLLSQILTVAIASVPAILVVKDRWLDTPLQSNLIGSWWSASGLAEATSFQPYFLIVFLCILTVSILVFILRAGPRLISSDSEILSSSPPATINPSQRYAGRILVGFGVFFYPCHTMVDSLWRSYTWLAFSHSAIHFRLWLVSPRQSLRLGRMGKPQPA